MIKLYTHFYSIPRFKMNFHIVDESICVKSKPANFPDLDFDALIAQLEQKFENERDLMSNASNFASSLWHYLRDSRGENALNWV